MALRFKWIASVIVVLLMFVNAIVCPCCFSSSKTQEIEVVSCELDAYYRIQFYERGLFGGLQQEDRSDTASKVAAISKQIRCNDAYYMLSYVHLTNPQKLSYPDQVVGLHEDLNRLFPGWGRKMLMTAFNIMQNDADEMDVAWLFYLHVIRIEEHAANDPDKEFPPVMQVTNQKMYDVLTRTMTDKECTMSDQPTGLGRRFTEYKTEIEQMKPSDVSALLGKHWSAMQDNSKHDCVHKEEGDRGLVDGVRPLTEEHLTSDLLCLNGVFEKIELVTTLLVDFGGFENGKLLIDYQKRAIEVIKSSKTTFRQYIWSLVDFHDHAQRALNTIMLRIYYSFMKELKGIDKANRYEHVKLFFIPYRQWCAFMNLRKNNNLYAVLWPDSPVCEKNFTDETIDKIQDVVIEHLIAMNKSNIPLENHTSESLDKIKIDERQLVNIADTHGIRLNPFIAALEPPIRKIILCAEVLIGYMNVIFAKINFKAIQSLLTLRMSDSFKLLL